MIPKILSSGFLGLFLDNFDDIGNKSWRFLRGKRAHLVAVVGNPRTFYRGERAQDEMKNRKLKNWKG